MIARALRSVSCVLLLISCACLHAQRFAPEDGWRLPHQDASHSRYRSSPLAPPLKTAWKCPIRAEIQSIVAAEDSLYVFSEGLVTAIHADTGAELWQYQLKTDRRVRCAAATPQGVVIYDDFDNKLLYLRKADRKPLFVIPLILEVPACILVGENKLLVCGNILSMKDPVPLYSVDLTTAKVTTEPIFEAGFRAYQLGALDLDSSHLFVASPFELVTLEGPFPWKETGRRYIGGENKSNLVASEGRLYMLSFPDVLALNRQAQLVWKTPLPGAQKDPQFDLNIDDMVLYDILKSRGFPSLAVTPTHLVVHDGKRLYALDKKLGKALWKREVAPRQRFVEREIEDHVAPLVTGNLVYCLQVSKPMGHANMVAALDIATGRQVWHQRFPFALGPMVAHRDALYLGASDSDHVHSRPSRSYLPKLVPARRETALSRASQ